MAGIDKNMAALLNENAYTLTVQYQHSLGESFTHYTYVTDLPKATKESILNTQTGETTEQWTAGIKPGDMVVVPTKIKADSRYAPDPSSSFLLEEGVRCSVAVVTAVHDAVEIEPDSSIAYAWVICQLDISNYYDTKKRNAEVMSVVAEAYTKNMRRSFAQQVLANLGDDQAGKIKLLLGSK